MKHFIPIVIARLDRHARVSCWGQQMGHLQVRCLQTAAGGKTNWANLCKGRQAVAGRLVLALPRR